MKGLVKKWVPPGCIPKDVSRENIKKLATTGWSLIETNDDEGVFIAVLLKTKQDKSFGLTISGGQDKEKLPHISNLKANGLAERSDLFCLNDQILEICEKDISKLNHLDIIAIVQSAGNFLKLKIQYKTPKRVQDKWKWKTSVFLLEKGKHGFEFCIKGGISSDKSLHRPVEISHILPNGDLEKMGILFPGDKILSIDKQPTTELHISAVNQIINQSANDMELEIEYPTHQKECQNMSANTFVVEINRANDRINFGITLNVSFEWECYGSIIVISEIQDGSLADRSGHLSIGNLVLSINHISLDGISLPQANQMLCSSPEKLIMKVMGNTYCVNQSYKEAETTYSKKPMADPVLNNTYHIENSIPVENGDRTSNYSTKTLSRTKNMKSFYGSVHQHNLNGLQYGTVMKTFPDVCNHGYSASIGRMSLHSNKFSERSSIAYNRYGQPGSLRNSLTQSIGTTVASNIRANGSCRCEIVDVVVNDKDLGVEIQDDMNSLVIVNVIPEKCLFKTGLVQPGDRILSINGTSTEHMICFDFHYAVQHAEVPITLNIEFDVSDSIIPNQGSFTVKMRKNRSRSVGLFLSSALQHEEEQYLRIYEIKTGSLAYRLGMLAPGDQLLSLNGQCVSHLTPENVYQLIENSEDPVVMTVKKDEEMKGPTFSIELTRNGESLGITISGSEHPFEPIIISDISEDGLAFRSNAVNVGDQILAINETTLRGKTLSQAYQLLHGAGNKVKFLIKRKPIIKSCSEKPVEEPQVWTWSGENSIHVINNKASISVVLEKNEVKSENVDTLSDQNHSEYFKMPRSFSRSKSRSNSYAGGSMPNLTTKRPSPLLEREVISLAQATSPVIFNKNPVPPTPSLTSTRRPALPLISMTHPIPPVSPLTVMSCGTLPASPSATIRHPILPVSPLPVMSRPSPPASPLTVMNYLTQPASPSASRRHPILTASPLTFMSRNSPPASPSTVSNFPTQPISPSTSKRHPVLPASPLSPTPPASPLTVMSSPPPPASPLTSRRRPALPVSPLTSVTPVDSDCIGAEAAVTNSTNVEWNSPVEPTKAMEANEDSYSQNLSFQSIDNEVDNIMSPVAVSPFKRLLKYMRQPIHRHVKCDDDDYKNEEPSTTSPSLFRPLRRPFVSSHKNNVSDTSDSDFSDISESRAFCPVKVHTQRLPYLQKSVLFAVSDDESVKSIGKFGEDSTALHRSKSAVFLSHVELRKQKGNDSFGFSISEGVADDGIFVRAIQENSLADMCGKMKPYDRVIQVNGVNTRNLSCDDVISLLQQAGKKLEIILERRNGLNM